MIKSVISINNIWLSRSSHLKDISLNGLLSKRNKATALNIVENLDETKLQESDSQNIETKSKHQHDDQLNGNKLEKGESGTRKTITSLPSQALSVAPASPKLPSIAVVPPTALLLKTSEEFKLKYGHSGKALQDKIALERQLRSPSLLNLVFANRKLSFYDTFTTPDHEDFRRSFHTFCNLRGPCKIMSESNANLLEDFVQSERKPKENLEKPKEISLKKEISNESNNNQNSNQNSNQNLNQNQNQNHKLNQNLNHHTSTITNVANQNVIPKQIQIQNLNHTQNQNQNQTNNQIHNHNQNQIQIQDSIQEEPVYQVLQLELKDKRLGPKLDTCDEMLEEHILSNSLQKEDNMHLFKQQQQKQNNLNLETNQTNQNQVDKENSNQNDNIDSKQKNDSLSQGADSHILNVDDFVLDLDNKCSDVKGNQNLPQNPSPNQLKNQLQNQSHNQSKNQFNQIKTQSQNQNQSADQNQIKNQIHNPIQSLDHTQNHNQNHNENHNLKQNQNQNHNENHNLKQNQNQNHNENHNLKQNQNQNHNENHNLKQNHNENHNLKQNNNENHNLKQNQNLNLNLNMDVNVNHGEINEKCDNIDTLSKDQENENDEVKKEKSRGDSIIEEDVIKEMLSGISRVKQKGTFVKIISQYLSVPKRYMSMRPPHREQEQKHAEDVLFDMFYNEETGLISMGKFLASLKTTGIRKNDPRIRELTENLKKVHKLNNYESGSSPETQHLNRETFKAVVAQNIVLIAKAFRQQFIIPDFAGFVKDIEDIYWKCKSNASGKVADYIPQLARYSPDSWGVSICTTDGQRFSMGDVEIPFTLQSCSKPLTYAIALEKLGADVVHSYIGQEPSGRNFNELVLDYNKKPHNPMINAGAILTCALLQVLIKPELTFAEKFDYTMSWFKRMSGGETIGFNNAVFLSEREAADRNYALGFYMRENKCYPKRTNLKEVMDFYFQCCSMETTCEAMSVVAATLANGGICPTTEEKVFRSEVVRDVLSIMHSCGTYDYSGQFAFKVGLPAKSGVSGGMMLVIPNVMGIFTWSPPLDQLGNPVRGVQFCEELVNAFNFHRFDNLKHASNKKDPRKHRYETKGLSIVNLLFSAASGDVTALRRHRLSGMDLTLADYDGRTALHLAASEGHLECVKFLLEHCRVPYNPKDRWGNMPIDEAQNFGHQSVIDYLTTYAEKTTSLDESNVESAASTAQTEEEMKPVAIDSYDRSAAASPIPSEASSSGMSDNTRPGL